MRNVPVPDPSAHYCDNAKLIWMNDLPASSGLLPIVPLLGSWDIELISTIRVHLLHKRKASNTCGPVASLSLLSAAVDSSPIVHLVRLIRWE